MNKLRGKIAKWLFTNRKALPSPFFYARWEDEIKAQPFTKGAYLKLADQILALIQEELEGLTVLDEKERKGVHPEYELLYVHQKIAIGDLLKAQLQHTKDELRGRLE